MSASVVFLRSEGGIGSAVGCALGATTEGQLPEGRRVARGEIRDYLPNRYAADRPVGLPSDDTQLAFWTLEQMIADSGFDPEKVAARFCRDPIFGIGSAVRQFVANYRQGSPWHQCGPKSGGNGALMRIAPMTIPHLRTGTPELWVDTALSAVITHMIQPTGRALLETVKQLAAQSPRLVDRLWNVCATVPAMQSLPKARLILVHLPGISRVVSQAVYSQAVRGWTWKQLKPELSTDVNPHPDVALLAWLEEAPSPEERHQAMDWLARSPAMLSAWPQETWRSLEERLGSDLDGQSKLLMAMANVMTSRVEQGDLAARYLLRAWSAGAQLEPVHLRPIARHLADLDADWCRTQTGSRTDAHELLVALRDANGGGDILLEWLPCFPVTALLALPEAVLVQLLKAAVSRATPAGVALLRMIGPRIAQPDSQALRDTAVKLATEHPQIATELLKSSLSFGSDWPVVARTLFPVLLQDRSSRQAVAETLDELSAQQPLLQGKDMVVLCLDNWTALQADKAIWPQLRQRRIEGSTLVYVVTKWLSHKDKPHRIDMMVTILRDVQKRTSPYWLTPLSLEFQALCAAGRFSEAEGILARHPDIEIKRQSAASHLASARNQATERKGVCEAEFARLWELLI